MSIDKKIFNHFFLLSLFHSFSCYGSENIQADDHPTRWIYESMNAWGQGTQKPQTYGRTGKGVGVAVIEGPNFNLNHPALTSSQITLIDFSGDNLETFDCNRSSQYHANHVTALIAGKLDKPCSDMDLGYLWTFKKDNPKLIAGYSPSNIPEAYYYSGLAPDAKIYAYPRKLETNGQDLGILLKIFEDIEKRRDVQLINLSFKLSVDSSLIRQMNRLADRGVIFIQAAGNDGFNLDEKHYQNYEAIQYVNGASYDDFSSTFWNRHIFVGALSCYKSLDGMVQAERWKDSSYYVKRDLAYTKNFMMAPGACVFSASQNGYDLKSGTSMATAFVTGALACALERPRDAYVPEILIDQLLSFSQQTILTSYKETSVPFLNLKGLIEADCQHDEMACSYFTPKHESMLDSYQGDHPTRWVYEAMEAWDSVYHMPETFGYTGANIGIAIVGAPYFNIAHPSLNKASISLIDTRVSVFEERQGRGPRAVPMYLGFEPPASLEIGCLKFGRKPARREPMRLPFNVIMDGEGPTTIEHKYKGKNIVPFKGQESHHWHSNHTTALIVGSIEEPYLEEMCPYSLLPYVKKNNPKLSEISYPGYRMRDIAYYGGLAPKAKVYAYPRDGDGSTYVLSAILEDIENRADVHIVNLNGLIRVNKDIIHKMNVLAEKGKFFVQAMGNASKNLDLEEHAQFRTIQCVDDASLSDFSATFWHHYIPVGALAPYKTHASTLGLEIWKDSCYALHQNDHFKNFILAPGACIVSAAYNDFYCDSNTRISAAFVTGALACALEAKGAHQNHEHLIADLLRQKHTFTFSSEGQVDLPILNIKNLVS